MNNGNIVGMVSSFVTSNGQTHEMADVWFQTSQVQSTSATVSLTTVQVAALTTSQVASMTTAGQIAALATAQIVGLSSAQIASLAPPPATALSSSVGLQSQVSGLTQAISSFTQPQSAVANSLGVALINTLPNAAVTTGAATMSVNVAGMVGALQQFGPNGNPAASPAVISAVPTSTTLTASPLASTTTTGMLTTFK
jgi:hypothetical protein